MRKDVTAIIAVEEEECECTEVWSDRGQKSYDRRGWIPKEDTNRRILLLNDARAHPKLGLVEWVVDYGPGLVVGEEEVGYLLVGWLALIQELEEGRDLFMAVESDGLQSATPRYLTDCVGDEGKGTACVTIVGACIGKDVVEYLWWTTLHAWLWLRSTA